MGGVVVCGAVIDDASSDGHVGGAVCTDGDNDFEDISFDIPQAGATFCLKRGVAWAVNLYHIPYILGHLHLIPYMFEHLYLIPYLKDKK